VVVYYTKLKKLWDEISDMSDIPVCTCPETCPSIKKNIDVRTETEADAILDASQ